MSFFNHFNWDVLAISLTFLLISIVPASALFYCYFPWLTFHNNYTWLWTLPFIFAVISIWFNYISAMFTSPGMVPKTYDPEKIFFKPKFKHRWCHECKIFKPPRAHHCRYCKACILKMDHHCPWVGTCIGYYNQGYFIRFIYSVTFACVYGLTLFGIRVYDLIRYQQELNQVFNNTDGIFRNGNINSMDFYVTLPATFQELLVICVDLIAMLLLLLLVGGLTVFQTSYVLSGWTTIESFEMERIRELVGRELIKPHKAVFPYDLGSMENLKSVFGQSVWDWGFPGLPHFNINAERKCRDFSGFSDMEQEEGLEDMNVKNMGRRMKKSGVNKRSSGKSHKKNKNNGVNHHQYKEELEVEVNKKLINQKFEKLWEEYAGLYFRVNEHYQAKENLIWPPLEYYRYRNDPNWNGEELDSDESDGYDDDNLEYVSTWGNEEEDGSFQQENEIEFTPNSLLAKRYIRRGSEGYEITIEPSRRKNH